MGSSSSKEENSHGSVHNKVVISNENISVTSNEILATLIFIAILLFIIVVMRVVSIIKKNTKQQAQRDHIILNRMPTPRQ